MNDIPRRNRIDLLTPAESAIREAMLAVEQAGAHPLLTEAVELLDEAKNVVGDFVDFKGEVDTEKILQLSGWTVECESPYEIRHEDGSFATGQAADIVTDTVMEGYR